MSNKLPKEQDFFLIDLAKAHCGKSYVVINVLDGAFMRLAEMGLTKGTIVKVIRTAPCGDPIEVEIRGYRLCLRKSSARQIVVRDVRINNDI